MLFDFIFMIKENLKSANLANFDLEAELIVSEVLKIKRMDFYIQKDYKLTESDKENCLKIVERRIKNEPLQYILGYAYFRELCLSVGEGVLIPRPETEIIIDIIRPYVSDDTRICDIATGSGAIALSIAYEIKKNIKIIGVDISEKALKYAKINQLKYNLENVEFMLGNLLQPCKNQKFNIITANLPYISSAEFAKLDCEVRNFEPKLALFAENKGLAIIEELIQTSYNYLYENGIIILEIGYEQGFLVEKILKDNNFKNIKIIQDYNKKNRFVMGSMRTS